MTDISKRCYRVHIDKKTLIVPNMYSDISNFARDLKYAWEHHAPIKLQNGTAILINPAFISMIDGPHDELFTIEWYQ